MRRIQRYGNLQYYFPAASLIFKRSQAKAELRAGRLCKVNQLGESIQKRLQAMDSNNPGTSTDTAQEKENCSVIPE